MLRHRLESEQGAQHAASIEPLDTGDARVHLRDGGVLPCSRRQREALRDRLVPAPRVAPAAG